MPLHAVSIEKETRFHGRIERFSNTYYYEGPLFQLGDANYTRLITQLADAEKLVHVNNVTFRTGRLWSAGGTAAQNETLILMDLAGTGTMEFGVSFSAENAVMVEWETSRANIRGRKVYLRKYIRPQGMNVATTRAMAEQRDPLSAAAAAPFKTYADTVERITTAQGVIWQLVSPKSRVPKASNIGVVDSLVRTREFRRN